jgi:hypothetical protein
MSCLVALLLGLLAHAATWLCDTRRPEPRRADAFSRGSQREIACFGKTYLAASPRRASLPATLLSVRAFRTVAKASSNKVTAFVRMIASACSNRP